MNTAKKTPSDFYYEVRKHLAKQGVPSYEAAEWASEFTHPVRKLAAATATNDVVMWSIALGKTVRFLEAWNLDINPIDYTNK